jgi:hypothetical protein
MSLSGTLYTGVTLAQKGEGALTEILGQIAYGSQKKYDFSGFLTAMA